MGTVRVGYTIGTAVITAVAIPVAVIVMADKSRTVNYAERRPCIIVRVKCRSIPVIVGCIIVGSPDRDSIRYPEAYRIPEGTHVDAESPVNRIVGIPITIGIIGIVITEAYKGPVKPSDSGSIIIVVNIITAIKVIIVYNHILANR